MQVLPSKRDNRFLLYVPYNKILRWCSNPLFCEKMTAHWNEREFWFYERYADSTVTVRYKRLKEKEKVHFASIVHALDGYFAGQFWFQ